MNVLQFEKYKSLPKREPRTVWRCWTGTKSSVTTIESFEGLLRRQEAATLCLEEKVEAYELHHVVELTLVLFTT